MSNKIIHKNWENWMHGKAVNSESITNCNPLIYKETSQPIKCIYKDHHYPNKYKYCIN